MLCCALGSVLSLVGLAPCKRLHLLCVVLSVVHAANCAPSAVGASWTHLRRKLSAVTLRQRSPSCLNRLDPILRKAADMGRCVGPISRCSSSGTRPHLLSTTALMVPCVLLPHAPCAPQLADHQSARREGLCGGSAGSDGHSGEGVSPPHHPGLGRVEGEEEIPDASWRSSRPTCPMCSRTCPSRARNSQVGKRWLPFLHGYRLPVCLQRLWAYARLCLEKETHCADPALGSWQAQDSLGPQAVRPLSAGSRH